MAAAGAKTVPTSGRRRGVWLIAFCAGAAVLFFGHLPYLNLPYFWDELGQFVPAALDILKDGAWVPHSTVPNVHPPGVMAYLAGAWGVFGYSIASTREAMLLLAAFGVVFVFVLGARLCGADKRTAASIAILLLLADPLFYMQSMMAQLDMPAMVFCVLGLLLFFAERHAAAAAACMAAVLAKETSAVLPLILAAALWRERGAKREVFYYAAPFLALAVWIAALWRTTGHPLGDPGFAHYNIGYALHPVRIAMSLLRRFYYLFIDNFRWLGTIAIVLAWRRAGIFNTREWKITLAFAAVFTILVSVLGGAELERYLMPVLPIYYIAVSAALAAMTGFARVTAVLALCGGLVLGMFHNPPFPFPLENNLAMVDFVELHHKAAQYLEQRYPRTPVYTAWPLTAALRRPEFGYVHEPLEARETSDLRYSTLAKLDRASVGVLVLYSRTWEPTWGVLQIPAVGEFLRRFYEYEPQMTADQVRDKFGLVQAARWEQRGQWVEVYARASL